MYAQSLDEAKSRYNDYHDKDPFPAVAPALLNCADIQDYVLETGMLFPFHSIEGNFKPASYSINFSGEYLFWEVNGEQKKRIHRQLKAEEHFILRRNSIAFIRLEPYIQLPIYIAARFNLQIKHVYRGLLLGTGPLIDPGYNGYLNIPIHNLTNEDYFIKANEPIIWIEFTKISYNNVFKIGVNKFDRSGKIYYLKKESSNRDLPYYLHRANPNAPIVSSLQEIITKTDKSLDETKKINETTNTLVGRFSISIIISIAGVITAVAGFFFNVYTIGNASTVNIRQSNQLLMDEHTKSMELKEKMIKYDLKIDSLKQKNEELQIELKKIKSKL